jgi:two-component system aerobic respiration control sensor histidine kinase ArcB
MKVLIVEDDRASRRALQRTLEKLGHAICWAATGEGALRLLETEEGIDLVMLDLDLGESIDGWEVARRKMLNPATSHIPVIITTGMTSEDIHAHGAVNPLAGALLTLSKPLDMEKLEAALVLVEQHAKPPSSRRP